MNQENLRILHLEDSQLDSEFIRERLAAEWKDMEFTRVETRAAFAQALEEFKPNIILLDHQLPDFNGLAALKIARNTRPETPVIMVTGTLSDIKALEMVKEGARDYVLKDNLSRLFFTVKRALAEEQESRTRKAAEKSAVQSKLHLRALFSNMLNGFAYCRMIYDDNQPHDFVYLEANAAFERLTGLKDVAGKKASEVIPGIRDSNPELFEIYGRVAAGGAPEKFETYVAALKAWLSITVYSMKYAHFVTIFDNITESKRLEQALLRKNAMYAMLSRTNSAIVHIHDQQALFDKICLTASECGWFCLAWVGVVDEASQRVVPVAAEGAASDYARAIVIHCNGDLPSGRGPTGTAIRENRHIVVNNFISNPTTAPWHDAAMRHGIRASMTMPIHGNGMRGALMVYATEPDFFQEDIVDLLLEMASDTSFALDNIQAAAQRKQDEVQLRLHAQVFSQSSEGMVISDVDNNIITVNQAYTEITGYTMEEMKGKNPRILQSGIQGNEFYSGMWEALLSTGSWQGEIWNRSKNGEIYPEWKTINTVKDSAGNIVNYLAISSDLRKKTAIEQLHHLQHFDALTDLPNRLLLEDRVSEAINHAQQYGRHIALLFVNLDRFHTINDLFGHATGDLILQSIAKRLAPIIVERGTLSRFSGDTFVVVLPDLNSTSEINPIVGLILDAISEPLSIAGQNLELTGRIGIAVFPENGMDFTTLMKNADLAMLHAREDGRNTYRYFTAALNDHAQRLLTISGDLRQALKNNWFVLHYQPQVNIMSGKIIGCEALIRLNHPEHGMVAPAKFITVAEETGLIVPVGEWVISEACRQMKHWHDEGHNDLVMALNVSPLQFRQPNLIDVIRRTLDESGLAPQYLELEFTESALMRNVATTLDLMKNLKGLGVHLSIDDFGTGYSSLNYLKQFPVDKLKIDQSFVKDIASDPGDASIVQAVIALARSMGLSTIAEGVETEAQFGYLRALHCNEMQGYYFSRPVPASEFLALLQREHAAAPVQSEHTLLLVDDEENVLLALKRILRREGYRILTAANANEGLEVMAKTRVDVVLSDQRMPGINGVEFLHRVKMMHPDVVRIILSGYTEVSTLIDAINKGDIYQFITKPWENEALIASVREAFLRHELLKKTGQ